MTWRPTAAPVRVPDAASTGILAGDIGYYWRAFWAQPVSFRLACAYIFFEYYRPQSIYPVLAVVPWSALCLSAGLFALVAEGGLRDRPRSPVSALFLIFSFIVLASTLVAWNPSLAWEQWESFWLWLPVYLLLIGTVTTVQRLAVFLALYGLWNAKMSLSGVKQWAGAGFQFRSWGVLGSPGPFNNSGEFSIEMVIYFSVLVMMLAALWPRLNAWKRAAIGLVVASAALSVVASSSRGAMGGLALASAWMVFFTRHRIRAAVGVAVLACVLFVATPPEFKARFTTVGTDASSVTRATYRTRGVEMIRDFPLLGVGYGNWLGYYRYRYREPGQVSHNIYIQAGAELGLIGLTCFLLLAASGFVTNMRTRRLADQLGKAGWAHAALLRNLAIGLDAGQIGFLGAGYFVTVLYYPFFWIGISLTVAVNGVAVQAWKAMGSPSPVATSRSNGHRGLATRHAAGSRQSPGLIRE